MVGKFLMILWDIWRERNEKYLKNSVVSASQTTFDAMEVLCDWMRAKNLKHDSVEFSAAVTCNLWHKPPELFVKCNVDASTFHDTSQAGVAAVFVTQLDASWQPECPGLKGFL